MLWWVEHIEDKTENVSRVIRNFGPIGKTGKVTMMRQENLVSNGKSPIGWVEYYMGLAFLIAQKSPDIHTKHGCIITDAQNIPLGMGFNGFPRGIDDTGLPLNRPSSDAPEDYYNSKYLWMVHAELNGLAHCKERPENGTAYVTGQCCDKCILALWQHGVKSVFMADRPGSVLLSNEHYAKWFAEFISRTKMKIEYIEMLPEWNPSV